MEYNPNLMATGLAALIPMIVGFVYYHPKVMGGMWMDANGFKLETMKPPKPILYLSLIHILKTNKIPDILSTETFPVPPPAKTEPNEEKPVVLFQSEFPDFESKDDKKQSMHPDKREEPVSDPIQYDPIVSRFNPVEIEAPEKFSFIRMIASRLKFKLHETVSTMDNSLLFGGCLLYTSRCV